MPESEHCDHKDRQHTRASALHVLRGASGDCSPCVSVSSLLGGSGQHAGNLENVEFFNYKLRQKINLEEKLVLTKRHFMAPTYGTGPRAGVGKGESEKCERRS